MGNRLNAEIEVKEKNKIEPQINNKRRRLLVEMEVQYLAK